MTQIKVEIVEDNVCIWNILPHVEVKLKIPISCMDDLIHCLEGSDRKKKGKIIVSPFQEEPDHFFICYDPEGENVHIGFHNGWRPIILQKIKELKMKKSEV
jgi:hypothetical protein